MRRQLISSDEAVPAKKQHRSCCSDCPFSRESLPGWLGGISKEDWMRAAHGEEKIDCHVFKGAQCAGAAIYRANVSKTPRDPRLLRLPMDIKKVFANFLQFMTHHGQKFELKRTRRKAKSLLPPRVPSD